MISDHVKNLDSQADKDSFTALIGPLIDAATPYTKSSALGVDESERAQIEFIKIFLDDGSMLNYGFTRESHMLTRLINFVNPRKEIMAMFLLYVELMQD